jgi:hypothetical protein
MDMKKMLNKTRHGYGKVVHNEEVEELDEVSAELIGKYSDKASKEYNDPKTPERKKTTRRAGLMLGYNKAKGRANVPATYKEEVDLGEGYTHDEVAKSLPKGLKSSDEILKHSFDHLKKTKGEKSARFHHGDEDYKSDVIDAYHSHNSTNESVELDETAQLDQYIKSMGYDPKNIDKNKKVMFSKTNAFKTWMSSRN